MTRRPSDWWVKQWTSETRWRFWPNLAWAVFLGGANLWSAVLGIHGWLLVAMLPCLIYNFVWMAIHGHAAQRYCYPWKRWEEEG